MIPNPLHVIVAGDDHGDEIAELRKACYRTSPSFSWFDEAALEWTDADRAAVVLAVQIDGRIVATSRATCRPDRDSVEAVMGYSLAQVPPRFPAMIAGRSATDPRYTRLGLTAIVRHTIVRQAMRVGVASIIGVVYESAPRVRSMLVHGYEPYPCASHWDREAVLRADPIIISMPAAAYPMSLRAIADGSSEVMAMASFDDRAIERAFDADVVRWLHAGTAAGRESLSGGEPRVCGGAGP